MTKKINLIVLDVDGTLTDGKIYIDSNGVEMKSFNVKDGMGIVNAQNKGIHFTIITGRTSTVVEKRAKELGISEVYQGIKNKLEIMDMLIEKFKITYANVMYIGDDVNDVECMLKVGVVACPNDAVNEVKNISHYISSYNGGEGAVREILEKYFFEN